MLRIMVIEEDWKGHLMNAGVKAAYMKYGIYPRAYYDGEDCIFMPLATWEACVRLEPWAVKLVGHEIGHALGVPMNDHPTKLVAMVIHARAVGWDTRAGTGLLRFNEDKLELIPKAKALILETVVSRRMNSRVPQ